MDFERGKDPKQAMELGLYIYDNGFGSIKYICSFCEGTRLEQKQRGGFQPPYYICKDCGRAVYAPRWTYVDEQF